MSLLTCGQAQAAPGLCCVWAVDDGEKVFQDDLSHPLKAGGGDNSVWDGSTVSLFAARNEVVAFQLILEADGSGASAVNVVVSNLTNGAATIRGSHPLLPPNDYINLGVELFTEHYFDISTPSWNSDCGGLGWSGEAKPNLTGLIPDALVPFAAKQGKGGAPFDIGPSLNQGVWVDVYVPHTAVAGTYTGTATVSVDGTTAATIPIELEVLDFTLSDENHYKTMVFYSKDTLVERHNTGWCTPEMWDMMLAYNRMAHRHRLELIGCGNWDEANNLTGTLTGDAFTAAGNYDGPGLGVGNSLFSIATYGGWWWEDQAYFESQSDAWVNWFNDNGLGDLDYFVYLTDEPAPALFPDVTERSGWIHDNPGPGHDLPVFLTKWPISDLVGSIDIWCTPPQLYDPVEAAAAEARGEPVWLYASYRPFTPADATDEYGIAWRVKAWIGHYRDIPRWFTWESTHYYDNSNEVWHVDPFRRKNVWADPIGFSRKWYDDGDVQVPCPMDTGNGDGILFYPGQDALFPEEDRDYPGPVSSIRMKMYRRGIQDVEYMWLAEQAGRGAQVQGILQSALPSVMWDAAALPTWSNANADYEAFRRQLANLLSGQPGVSVTVGNATVTYEYAGDPGLTSIVVTDELPAPPPGDLTFVEDFTYHLSTTATVSGTVTVAVDYGDTAYPPVLGERLSLLLWEGAQWTDITTAIDTAGYTITGQFTPGAESDWYVALALDRPGVPQMKVMFDGCTEGRPNGPGLFVANADLTEPMRLTLPDREADFCGQLGAVWSPDATKVAMARPNPGGPWVLQVLDLQQMLQSPGQAAETLTDEVGQPVGGEMPAWSPTGDRLVYGHWLETEGRVSIRVVNADGTGAHEIGVTSSFRYPDWSPDGTRVVFEVAAEIHRDSHLYLLENIDDPGGPTLRRLATDDACSEEAPHWSPDGTRVAFTRFPTGGQGKGPGSEIWIMDVDTGAERQLTDSPELGMYATSWCPYDGCVYYVCGPGSQLRRVLPDGTGDQLVNADTWPLQWTLERVSWMSTGVWIDGLNALPGESVAAKLGIADADNLAGVQAKVRYTGGSDTITFDSVLQAESILDWAMPSPSIGPDVASFLAYASDPATQAVSGPNHLFDLNLTNSPTAQPGDLQLLTFDELKLSDDWGDPIERVSFDGGVHTIPFAYLEVTSVTGPVCADAEDPVPFTVTLTALDWDGFPMPDCNVDVELGSFDYDHWRSLPQPVTPTGVALVDGEWTGEVSFPSPAASTRLLAHWGDFAGYSNWFQAIGKGDANADNRITIFDVIKVANMAIDRGVWADWQRWSADLNGDGGVDIFDVVMCANRALEETQTMGLTRSTSALVAPPSEPVVVATDITTNGAQTVLTISLSNCAGLAGVQVDLDYDAEKLTYAGVSSGALLTGARGWSVMGNDLGGRAKAIAYTASADVLPGGEGAILTFTFSADGKGKPKLDVTSVKLADVHGNEIPSRMGAGKGGGRGRK